MFTLGVATGENKYTDVQQAARPAGRAAGCQIVFCINSQDFSRLNKPSNVKAQFMLLNISFSKHYSGARTMRLICANGLLMR